MSTFTVMCPICSLDQPRVPCCEKCQAAYDLMPPATRRTIQTLQNRLTRVRDIVGEYSLNEGTSHPWWAVVRKNAMGANAILAGPFFSRERAEQHRAAREYEYGRGSIVFCFSGHRSVPYVALREALGLDRFYGHMDAEPREGGKG